MHPDNEATWRRQLVEEEDALRAEGFRGDLPPEQEPIRFVSYTEVASVHAEFLRLQGFATRVVSPSGIGFDPVPPDRRDAFARARYLCRMLYPIDPNL